MNLTLNSWFKGIQTLLIGFFTALVLMTTFALTTHAQELETKPIEGVTQHQYTYDSVENEDGLLEPVIPIVTIDQASEFIEGKIYDVIKFLQILAKPLCILMGVVSCMVALLGVFGDSGMVAKGITGIVLAALCYFLIMYAPQLIALLNSWMAEGSETVLNQTL